jgi:PilZ domain
MLEESLPPQSKQRRVWLQIRQPALQAFLEVMLRDWRYQPCDEFVADGLLLAEEGTLEPPPNQQTVWLSHSTVPAGEGLQFPLDITELRAQLERCYHNPPRRHLRLVMEMPCELSIPGRRVKATIISLSDRGCRLNCAFELARGVQAGLRVELAGHPFRLLGKVIYCADRYFAEKESYYDLGLHFVDRGQEQRAALLDFIVASNIIRAKARLPAEVSAAALSWFVLNDGVRRYLEVEPRS